MHLKYYPFYCGFLLCALHCGSGTSGADVVLTEVAQDVAIDQSEDTAIDATQDVVVTSGWRTEQRLPLPRQEIAAAVVGERIYVVGGFEASRPTNTVRIFDPMSNTWSVGPMLPDALHHVSLVEYQQSLYVVGGMTGFGFIPDNRCFVLRSEASQWESIAGLPQPRGAGVAGVINGKIYLVGGVGSNNSLLTTMDVYDIATNQWSSGPDLPTRREHLAGFVYNGKFYVLGGRLLSLSSNLATVEVFDPQQMQWDVTLPNMTIARGGFGASILGNFAYIVGGETLERALNEVERYDLVNGGWQQVTPIPTQRHGHAMVTLHGKIWVIGGGNEPTFAAVPTVESYVP